MNGYIVVLDANLNYPRPWLASRHERTIDEILFNPTHDGAPFHVRRDVRDMFVQNVALRDLRTGRVDPGKIFRLV